MDFSFIKNPIVLAIVAGVIAYLYMYYDNMKKQEANPKAKIEPVSFSTAGIIALVTLVITYGIFGFGTRTGEKNIDIPVSQQGGFTDGAASDSFGKNTFQLVGKNTIKLPQTDVFIDLAHF
ncbi:hypothetical protein Indivirus_4_31 [Indivirus ILV1]|uniref:Uncharacterized protein n=1 Tax=Indivirus ILV1 TaxID=1977633 RepID=A0A1V0SDR2_9VIRU|nr:hypothetical protein Indivirus_4_31 [Indivirus ILV1]